MLVDLNLNCWSRALYQNLPHRLVMEGFSKHILQGCHLDELAYLGLCESRILSRRPSEGAQVLDAMRAEVQQPCGKISFHFSMESPELHVAHILPAILLLRLLARPRRRNYTARVWHLDIPKLVLRSNLHMIGGGKESTYTVCLD